MQDLNITKLPYADWQILKNNTLQNRRSPKTAFYLNKQFTMRIKPSTKLSKDNYKPDRC
jgi:hypothetical protein